MPKPNHQGKVKRISRLARGTRAAADARGVVEELSATRRSQVYRTDVEFAPETRDRTPRGTWQTPEIARQIGELRAAGLTYEKIALHLDGPSIDTVRLICREHGFTKGSGN